MKSLLEIVSFGGTDADADDLLDQAFQDHEAYIEAIAHRRPLVVGRKGSGKTAIYRKIIDATKDDTFSYGHTFSDYPWAHHHLQGSIGVPEEQRFVHSWQYLILLTLAKVLLNKDHSQPWSEDGLDHLDKLERFVVDSYGSRDPDLTQLFTPGKRLKVKPHLKIAGVVDLGVDLESVPVAELPKLFQEINRSIANSVNVCLNPDHQYYVCFDELDKGFDPRDPSYSQMLIGLILAASSLNQRFKKNGKRTSIVLCLRDDIYQTLQFEDKNKLTESSMSLIEWDSSRTKWTLQTLLEGRFGVALDAGTHLAWDKVFDETQEMAGRQKKYRHILDRTFRRPRDAIKFCNEILRAYKARGGAEDGKFDNQDVTAARNSYSEYLLKELEDEIFKHIPEYRNFVDILKSLEALQFSSEDFEQACKRRQDLLGEGITSVVILRQLFEFSVIGYMRTGGVGGGSEYVWRYLDPTIRFDDAATSFRVHPGLMEALGLKKFSKSDTQS
jgi:hypothetical protein